MVSQAERVEIAKRRIETARSERRRVLTLSGFELEELPATLFELRWLEELDLSGNCLNELSEDFGKLDALATLLLKGNRLTALPEGVVRLDALRTLDVSGNQLTVVPSELGRLEHLDVRGNRHLRFPPPGIVALGEEQLLTYLREHRDDESGATSGVSQPASGGAGDETVTLRAVDAGPPGGGTRSRRATTAVRPANARKTVLTCVLAAAVVIACGTTVYLVLDHHTGGAHGPSSVQASGSDVSLQSGATPTAGAGAEGAKTGAPGATAAAASASKAPDSPYASSATGGLAGHGSTASAAGASTPGVPGAPVSPSVAASGAGSGAQTSPADPVGPITGFDGVCLTASSSAGNPVYVEACDGGTFQQWTIEPDGTIESGGQCLDVENAGVTAGTPVDTFTCNGTGAQQWQAGAGGSLANGNSGLCLNDTDFTTDPGLQMQVWSCNGGSNEVWRLP